VIVLILSAISDLLGAIDRFDGFCDTCNASFQGCHGGANSLSDHFLFALRKGAFGFGTRLSTSALETRHAYFFDYNGTYIVLPIVAGPFCAPHVQTRVIVHMFLTFELLVKCFLQGGLL